MTAGRAQPHESLETQALALLEQVGQRAGTRDPRRQLVRGLRRLSGVVGAWLGRPDESGQVVANAVSDRRIRAYLATVSIRVDQTAEGMGPVGRAWRSERVAWVDDWRSDPAGSPWARQVAAIGVVSSVSIVLHGRSGVREILTLYSDRRACFSVNGWPRLIEYISSIFGVVLEE